MTKVAVLMGSPNDRAKMQPAVDTLDKFGLDADVRVLSAHRTPHGQPIVLKPVDFRD